MSSTIRQLQPAALAEALKSEPGIILVDVRDPWEVALCALPDARSVPLSSLGEEPHVRALLPQDRDAKIVTYCHHGVRSMRAAEALCAMGYTNVSSLQGGIDAWSEEVDHSMARY